MTDYFTDDKKLVVKTRDGREFVSQSESSEPSPEKDREIREGKKSGKITFKDEAVFEEGSFEVEAIKLVYDGETIALRKVKLIKVQENDTLKVTYKFNIERKTGGVVGVGA